MAAGTLTKRLFIASMRCVADIEPADGWELGCEVLDTLDAEAVAVAADELEEAAAVVELKAAAADERAAGRTGTEAAAEVTGFTFELGAAEVTGFAFELGAGRATGLPSSSSSSSPQSSSSASSFNSGFGGGGAGLAVGLTAGAWLTVANFFMSSCLMAAILPPDCASICLSRSGEISIGPFEAPPDWAPPGGRGPLVIGVVVMGFRGPLVGSRGGMLIPEDCGDDDKETVGFAGAAVAGLGAGATGEGAGTGGGAGAGEA